MRTENGVIAYVDRGVVKLQMWKSGPNGCSGKIVPVRR